ncbi:MAG: GUN4 domain-containing protein [Thermoleptolyngbya sp. C42_A2020_037]|nr:GUN4 domain-containing protein [Thermoleptolyngbya sp. C42_A2020_037]
MPNSQKLSEESIPQLRELAFSNEELKRLGSEQDIKCIQLKTLLSQANWVGADYETYRLMLQMVDREVGQWIQIEELKNFPCADLRAIDYLWTSYSGERFGFSVQRKIYLDCGGKLDYRHDSGSWNRFLDCVGWQKEKMEQYSREISKDWIPEGHFPRGDNYRESIGGYTDYGGWVAGGWLLLSHLAECNLK